MSDRVAGNFIVTGNMKTRPLMTGQLQNYKRKTELKNDLERDQASKRVVISLFGGRKKSRNQGDGYEAGSARPGSCKNRKTDCPIDSKNPMHPVTDRCKPRCLRWGVSHSGKNVGHSSSLGRPIRGVEI